jgi:transketolase
MIGVATGLACRKNIPFCSTIAAFLMRAADQIRIAAISGSHLKIVGTHAGVSIGEDGPSLMAL